ncbi:MAG: hypothetical protein ACYSX0_02645 [Planctomycetota bacterium]
MDRMKFALLGAALLLAQLTCGVQHVHSDGESDTRWFFVSQPLLDTPTPAFILDFDGDGRDDFWTEQALFLTRETGFEVDFDLEFPDSEEPPFRIVLEDLDGDAVVDRIRVLS